MLGWGVRYLPPLRAGVAAALVCAWPLDALAQKAGAYATNQAQDAFGVTVGPQTIGLYSETDIRGFNPQQAGNARVEEVYVDLLNLLIPRVKESSAVRVGFTALGYPSPAPSGIVAYRLRDPGDEFHATAGINAKEYGGSTLQYDAEHPIIKGHMSLQTGIALGDTRYADGINSHSLAMGLIPEISFKGVDIKSYFSLLVPVDTPTRPLVLSAGGFLPPMIPARRSLVQKWATNRVYNYNNGVVVRAELSPRAQFRGGFLQSRIERKANYTELFNVQDPSGSARHTLLSDPRQDAFANSWEGVVYYRLGQGRLRNTLSAGLRGRHRRIESGGSDRRDFGVVALGTPDPETQPVFIYGPVNVATIRQNTYSVGYVGRLGELAQLNLGLSKADYRGEVRTAAGVRTGSSAKPWLYNASLLVSPTRRLSVYGGFVNGLEDSGVAPESAENRNGQLPASRTSQLDGGVKISAAHMRLVASVFEMKKPNFSFDAANIYRELGRLRLRGLEVSATGDPTPRLHILAGALLMDPVVTGEARTLGLVGERPVGIPKVRIRVDASYRTDILHGLTFTAAAAYDGRRAASARPYAALGGQQVFLPAYPTFDLGFRHNFTLRGTPMSVRFVANNVLNERAWKALSSNVFQLEEVRRYNLYLLADF